MTLLSAAEFVSITDSLGLQWAGLRALGATAEGVALLGASATNLRRVQDIAASKLVRGLIAAYDDQHDKSATPWSSSKLWLAACLAALNNRDVTGGFAAFLEANADVLVSQNFADALANTGGYPAIPALRILDPRPRVASMTIGTPGSHSFLEGTPLASNATMELVTGSVIGPLPIDQVAVTLLKADLTTTDVFVDNIGAGAARGTVFPLGAGTYIRCTAIEENAGTSQGTRNDILFVRATAVDGTVRTPAP